MPHRPLPEKVDFPKLEEGVLERWRELDVYNESLRRREGAKPYVFYEGPPTANGRPGSHHVLARVFKDVFPRFQTMRGFYSLPQGRLGLPRPAGRDRRPAAARDREQGADRGIRDRGVQPEVPRERLRVPRGLGEADRAHRLLGRHGRPLPDARQQLHRVGLVGAEAAVGQGPALRGLQGRPVLPEGRHGAVLARGLAGLSGRRGPERLRPLPDHQARRRAARGRPAAGVDDDAVDAGLQRRRRRRPRAHLRALRPTARCWPRRSSPACSARTRPSPIASPAPRCSARATSRRSRSSPRPTTARRATPSCPATSCPPRTAPASSTPRSPSARTTSASAPSRA